MDTRAGLVCSALGHCARRYRSGGRSRCAGGNRCGTVCRFCNAGGCRAGGGCQIRSQRQEIEELRGKVRAGDAQRKADLTAAEEKYVAALAARDRAYAQEIAVFRKAVEDIAATPEGRRPWRALTLATKSVL